MVRFWWKPSSWFPSNVKKELRFLYPIREHESPHRDSTHMTSSKTIIPKGYLQIPSHWGSRLQQYEFGRGGLPGASVRSSAHGKGHEEGGLMQRRDRASGGPLFRSIYPQKPESAYFTALCSHLHLWLYGGLSPTTSLGEGVNLQLQLIKIRGCDKSVSTYKLLWSFSSLPEHIWPHVIIHSLPTVRGMRCFKLLKYRFFWEVRNY